MRLLLAIAIALLVSACTTAEPVWTPLGPWPAADGRLPGPPQPAPNFHCFKESTTACAAVAEYDDTGAALDRAQMLGAVEGARRAAADGATVVVYVHGWHENAQREAPDLQSFMNFVHEANLVDARHRVGPASGRPHVFGIYVGWRGDSIAVRHASRTDAWQAETSWTLPLSYLLTFWNRKGAAQRIGASGGVYELFERLAAVRAQHADSRLVIHGHSFGGALVYSAFSTLLVDQIMADGSAGREAGIPARRASSERPLADLVVLLNPAFEAMRLRPQLDLARTQEYPGGGSAGKPLPPRLVILTTEADWATRLAFPLGRKLGTMTDIYPEKLERQMRQANVTAVGHYIPYITHQLVPLPLSQPCPVQRRDPREQSHVMELQEPTLCIPGVRQSGATEPVPPLLLARCDDTQLCSVVAPGHFLARGPVAQGLVPLRLPVMNIRTVAAVSDSHTDIWNPLVQSFMLQVTTLAVRSPGQLPMAPAPPAR
jgi:hypothetical protein